MSITMNCKKLILMLVFLPLLGWGQGLTIARDTVSVTFPNQVQVNFNKQIRSGKSYYQLSQQSTKTLLATTHYYLQREALLTANQQTFLKEQQVMDSTFTLMKQKFNTEQERSKNFQQSYEELKTISAKYDEQLRLCASDLEKLNAKVKRAQRIGIVKGVSIGLGLSGLVWLASSAF
ncbi:MAG: hypothetical protein EBR30_26640 [Cytophagia bacterium]|nr:hypothetical protein [Cytophagia bacterium]